MTNDNGQLLVINSVMDMCEFLTFHLNARWDVNLMPAGYDEDGDDADDPTSLNALIILCAVIITKMMICCKHDYCFIAVPKPKNHCHCQSHTIRLYSARETLFWHAYFD